MSIQDKQIAMAEAVLRALLLDMGTTKFVTALHNVGAHGEVFKEQGNFISDSQLGLWFQGVKLLQSAADCIEGNKQRELLTVVIHPSYGPARTFVNMYEATQFVHTECHGNRLPEKIEVVYNGLVIPLSASALV